MPYFARKRALHETLTWGAIIGVLAAALILRITLNDLLGTEYPFVTIFPAIAFAAYARGFFAALLVAALAYFATGLWVTGHFLPADTAHTTGVILYCITALAIGSIGQVRVVSSSRIHASEERYRLIFENAPLGIAISRGGKYLVVNDAFCRISGRTRAQLLGVHAESLMPPEWVEKRRNELIPTLEAEGVWQGDFVLQRPDGKLIQIEAYTQVQADGTVLALMSDVTARRQAEERVASLNLELEQRVNQRTKELSAANDQLQGFTYSIAHDLRQHIRGLNINAAMIMQDTGDLLPSETRTHLTRMRNAAKQMAQLVDDLLTNARLGTQPVNSTEVDVTELARVAAASVEGRDICRQGTRFDIQEGLRAQADASLLSLVFENLFDNSCKYSHDDRPPVIHLRFDGAAFCVEDDGLGFEMQFASKIFEPFQRLHRAEVYPGTGIGLANVRRIIEKHGGRIWAESTPGDGAKFYFTLPGAYVAPEARKEAVKS